MLFYYKVLSNKKLAFNFGVPITNYTKQMYVLKTNWNNLISCYNHLYILILLTITARFFELRIWDQNFCLMCYCITWKYFRVLVSLNKV